MVTFEQTLEENKKSLKILGEYFTGREKKHNHWGRNLLGTTKKFKWEWENKSEKEGKR